MFPRVVSVEPIGGRRLRIRFDDGVEGEIDVAATIRFEGVFASLRDDDYFRSVAVDAESGTIAWPNGADLDPLVLYSRVTGDPVALHRRR